MPLICPSCRGVNPTQTKTHRSKCCNTLVRRLCPYCGKMFSYANKRHEEQSCAFRPVSDDQTPPTSLYCPTCDSHNPTQTKTHRCKECGTLVRRRCPYCSELFSYPNRKHELLHCKSRPTSRASSPTFSSGAPSPSDSAKSSRPSSPDREERRYRPYAPTTHRVREDEDFALRLLQLAASQLLVA